MILLRTLLVLFSTTVPTVSSSLSSLPPTVQIDSGPLIGRRAFFKGSNNAVAQFLGIPFAEPPLKQRRFALPEPVSNWTSPLNVMRQPPACLQNFGPQNSSNREMQVAFFNTPAPPSGESEDCLYLNVYTPIPTLNTTDAHGSKTNTTGKAVLFWLFGGGLQFGTAAHPYYDGTSFAANQDIIVVSPNYRTNVFGFPRSPQLPLKERNPGIYDQRLALDWVQRNIHVFGGDPTKVTVVGQSAGAQSVGNFINTYGTTPPFRGAISESGQSVIDLPPTLQNDDTSAWTDLVQALNCSSKPTPSETLACTRAADASTIINTVSNKDLNFDKSVDDTTVSSRPFTNYTTRTASPVPHLLGTTANDGSTFVANISLPPFLFLAALGVPLIPNLDITTFYRSSPEYKNATQNELISATFTDGLGACADGFVANATRALLGAPAWQYLYNATFQNLEPEGYNGFGVYHSSEISVVFGTYPEEDATRKEIGLSREVQKIWADFVKDPVKGPGWAQWPDVRVIGTGEGFEQTSVRVERMEELFPVCGFWYPVYGEEFLRFPNDEVLAL